MLAYYPPEWESLQSRIVGRWCPSFSGNTGLQLPDTSGFGNHGTLTNMDAASDWVASGGKLALDFDGADDGVTASFRTQATTQLTMSVWARLRSTGGSGTGFSRLFSRANVSEFAMSYQSSGLAVAINGTTNVFAYNAPGTRFDHLCATWNGATVTAFVNGVSIGSASFSGTIAASTTTLNLGGVSGLQRTIDGLADDWIVFNTAPTANDLRFIYEQGRGGGLLLQPPRRRSVAAIIAALVLACETANYSLTGQAAGLFASRLLAADQAQYLLSGNAANITASRLLSVDPASYTATGNDAATICARLLDGGAAAYALTGTDAGLIANRKLTADQAVYFLAGNNAELLRSLKLNAGSMSLELDNLAASLLADRKISADGAQYLLVVSDANLGDSASGVAPYYYLFMMRGPQ
jgi:hypothetical protein